VPDPAFDAEAYFSELGTIRLVANSNPGGGTDAQGRLMATFLSDFIPGSPRIVLTNSPNKDGEFDYAGSKANKDGSYISWTSTPEIERGYRPEAKVKRRDFLYLGSPVSRDNVWMTYGANELGYTCAWDAKDKPNGPKFTFMEEIADAENGSATLVANVAIAEDLNLPFEYFAVASASTSDHLLSWERGDTNSTTRSSLWYQLPATRPGWSADGLVQVMADLGVNPVRPNAEATPVCDDVRKHMSADAVALMDGALLPSTYVGKSLWLPPGTPTEVWEALGKAFTAAFSDPEVVARYEQFTGDTVEWTAYEAGQAATQRIDPAYEATYESIDVENQRIFDKYFK
jgi:hypothetical protein